MPLVQKNGELHIVLTQRTEQVEHHKGQISFPGGTMDETDLTILDTALREAEEEIGLKKDSLEILGLLSDFQTPSGFRITPVAALLLTEPLFSINSSEVSEVFDVPLSFFLDTNHERVEQRDRFGTTVNIYYYNYEKYEIWGATAAMLRSFLYDIVTWSKDKKPL